MEIINGGGPMFFLNFKCVFDFININRNAVLQGKWMEIAMLLPTAAGQFYFVFFWLTVLFSRFFIIPS
jgi:hypothetical protein